MSCTKVLFLVPILAICPGCMVFSTQPLATLDTLVDDDRLIGAWRVHSATPIEWTVARDSSEPNSPLRVAIRREGETNIVRANVARIGESLYLDLTLTFTLDDQTVPLHEFFRLTFHDDYAILQPFSMRKLEALLDKKPNALEAEQIASCLVLDSDPETLQAFFEEHGRSILDKPTILKRVYATAQKYGNLPPAGPSSLNPR